MAPTVFQQQVTGELTQGGARGTSHAYPARSGELRATGVEKWTALGFAVDLPTFPQHDDYEVREPRAESYLHT